MNDDKHALKAASGVDELIARLRAEGLEAGREEAEKCLAQAHSEAEKIVQHAQQKADEIVSSARQEAEKLRRGGEEALQIALRDFILKLKSKLTESVSDKVKQLIQHQLRQESFLEQLILQLAGKSRLDAKLDDQQAIVVMLPESLIGLDELRQNPLELKEGTLSHFILSVAADVLREGVEFAPSKKLNSGISIYIKDKDIQMDFTDERLSQLLLEHLQPRFRAILEGMVK